MMYLIRPSTVLLALAISSPALWQALVTGTLPVTDALIRFLIALPVAIVMLSALRALTAGYRVRAAKAAGPLGLRGHATPVPGTATAGTAAPGAAGPGTGRQPGAPAVPAPGSPAPSAVTGPGGTPAVAGGPQQLPPALDGSGTGTGDPAV
jgi:hypothetical protein